MDGTSLSFIFFALLHGIYASFLAPIPFNADFKSVNTGDDISEFREHCRIAVGVLGNAVCLLLYSTPIITFVRIIKNKSTEEFSCIPYVTALLNCLIYTWYGSPFVSHNWENLPLVTINGLGILLELSFIFIFFWFAPPRGKKMISFIIVPVVIAFTAIVLAISLVLHDRHIRKAVVGSIGLVFSVTMYGSPLVVMKQVIETKSVEFMPFHLSLFTFLTSTLWLIYALLGNDVLLAAPNFLGSPLGFLQLVLYCMYRRKRGSGEEPHRLADFEQNREENLEAQQPLIQK